ncbi:MAG: uroporphyrinogen-III synthase, partial [Heliobacteriaceae bacterium]|nr:uroporphyrinogen-III synthase [Heliobacteriaceae bacterium]
QITAKLMEYGRSPDTPVALIRWGTRPEQRTLTGTLQSIAGQAQRAGFQNPAVIVVGEVVRLREQLAWFEHRPLFGKRIVVTRARQQASVFAAALAELGAEPWEFPAIAIARPLDPRPLDQAIIKINRYGWIIFTSPNGVESFFHRYFALGRDIRELTGIQLGAIGPQTAKALEKFGLKVAFMPSEYRAEAIIAGLKDFNWNGIEVLLPRADIARKLLATGLADLGAVVDDVVAYRTVRGDGDAVLLRQLLRNREIQAVTFTSSSTVRNFIEMLGVEGCKERQELLNGVVLASIGPVTSGTLREAGLWVDVEASEYTIPGLTRALLQYWNHPVQ